MDIAFYALFLVVILLISILWYIHYMNKSFKRRLEADIKEAEETLSEAFDTLRKNAEEQFKFLQKAEGKWSIAEEEWARVMKQFNKDLNDAEKSVRKEIEDIEKAVK